MQYIIQCTPFTKAQSATEHIFKPLSKKINYGGEIYVAQIKWNMGGEEKDE